MQQSIRRKPDYKSNGFPSFEEVIAMVLREGIDRPIPPRGIGQAIRQGDSKIAEAWFDQAQHRNFWVPFLFIIPEYFLL